MVAHEDRLRQCCDLVDILSEDVARHLAESQDRDEPFITRGFVRCLCAYIEGVTHVMKQVALLEIENHAQLFSPAEVLLLSEVTPDLKDNGAVVEKRSKLVALPNMRFALLCFAKANNIELKVDFSGREWSAVRRAFEVRGKLMHPKSVSDLEISDDEAKTVLGAGEWFHKTFLTVMRQTSAKPRVAEMKKKLVERSMPAVQPVHAADGP